MARWSVGAVLVPLALAGCYGGVGPRTEADSADEGDDGEVPPPAPDCDLQAVFAHEDNRCTAQGCHGVQHVAGLDLASDGLAERLVGRPSTTAACSDRLLVDPAQPDRSLLLTQLTPAGVESGCGVLMPVGSEQGVADEDLACIQEWVEHFAQTVEPVPEVDHCDQFEPSSPAVYVSKVKNIMTGLRATTEEIERVQGDPDALASLAREWIEAPQFEARLRPFLRDALQYSVDLDDLEDKIGGLPEYQPLIEADLGESFRRTMMRLIEEDRPFTEIATTRHWEVTTFTLAILAYLDAGEDERKEDHLQVLQPPPGVPDPIPLEYSLEHLIWPLPPEASMCDGVTRRGDGVLTMLLGRCKGSHSLPDPVFEPTDFTDWRTVELVPAGQPEPEPVFWDVPALRAVQTQMEVGMPRVGFLTHPAFLARWETNADNQFRVTTNQALLVMTGHTFEVSDPTELAEPSEADGLDAEHADPDSACYACHRALDPMRVFYQNAFDYDYTSLGVEHGTQTPAYTFRGQAAVGGDLYDFAELLAQNPDFAVAWARKLCYWANSQACDEDDPELLRVAQVFEDSGYSFKTLVVELLTSPLVTGHALTQTYCSRPFLVSITRRDQLCHSLDVRLGQSGLCDEGKVSKLVELVPEDSIARGDPAPVVNPVSSAFHAAGVEQLCIQLAQDLVGPGGVIPADDPDAAVSIITESLMGIPAGSARHEQVSQVLQAHLQQARQTASEADAIQSAFTLGCLSSDLQAIGL
ncbi:MAG: hypothetical protein AAGF11_36345 [Myxococcota bacterium]